VNSTAPGVQLSVPVLVTFQPVEKWSPGLNSMPLPGDCHSSLQSRGRAAVGLGEGEGTANVGHGAESKPTGVGGRGRRVEEGRGLGHGVREGATLGSTVGRLVGVAVARNGALHAAAIAPVIRSAGNGRIIARAFLVWRINAAVKCPFYGERCPCLPTLT
jgi:hypothetical protein